MRDFNAFRRSAVRYWERRRIIYNLALVLPALFGYGLADTLNWVGDPHETHYAYIIPLFLLSAVGANICYSFAYALEFVFGCDDPISRWMRFGRTTAFVGGVLFAMVLALFGGREIADMEWYLRGHVGYQQKGQVLVGSPVVVAELVFLSDCVGSGRDFGGGHRVSRNFRSAHA